MSDVLSAFGRLPRHARWASCAAIVLGSFLAAETLIDALDRATRRPARRLVRASQLPATTVARIAQPPAPRPYSGNRARRVLIPEPLTNGQIAAMTFDEAIEAMTHISRARRTAKLDDETAVRLKREFMRVKMQWRRLVSEGRGAGGGP